MIKVSSTLFAIKFSAVTMATMASRKAAVPIMTVLSQP